MKVFCQRYLTLADSIRPKTLPNRPSLGSNRVYLLIKSQIVFHSIVTANYEFLNEKIATGR